LSGALANGSAAPARAIELEGLSDATLRDIGITRCDVHREAHKPFWMA